MNELLIDESRTPLTTSTRIDPQPASRVRWTFRQDCSAKGRDRPETIESLCVVVC